MIEIQFERRFGIAPIAFVFAKAQLLVIGEGHLAKYRRQVALRRLVRRGRQFLGLAGHVIQAERPAAADDKSHAQAQQIAQRPAAAASVRSLIQSGKHGAS